MTIVYEPARAAALAAADNENNPVILWDNIATASSISCLPPPLATGPASNATTGATYDFLSVVAVVSVRIGIDTGSPVATNCAAIAAHNLADIGATISVQYFNGTSWADAGAGAVTPTNNDPIMWRYTQRTADEWRLFITVPVSTDTVNIGVIMFGNELVIPERIYQGYAPPFTPNQVELQSNVSEGSHLLGSRVVGRGSTAVAPINHLGPAYLRSDTWADFQQHFNNGRGFFWGWRPTAYADEIKYAWRNGDAIAPTNSGPQRFMDASLSMRFYEE